MFKFDMGWYIPRHLETVTSDWSFLKNWGIWFVWLMVRLCRVYGRWKCSCVVRFVVVCLVDVYFCFCFCFHFALIWLFRINLLLQSHTLLSRSCCASGCTVSARVCYVCAWMSCLFLLLLFVVCLLLFCFWFLSLFIYLFLFLLFFIL